MHTPVILLAHAHNEDDARDLVTEFLEPYHNKVYDWYEIGGRYSNNLMPADKKKEFYTWLCEVYPGTKADINYVKIQEHDHAIIVQTVWEDIGLKGPHIFSDENNEEYIIRPLKDCINEVQEHVQNLTLLKQETWKEMLAAKDKEHDLSAYYAQKYVDISYGHFNFDTGVYDISNDIAENIPDELDNWYAIVVDLHH